MQSEAGNVRGQVTADVKAPDLAASGNVEVERLNLAPLLKNPAQRSDITGRRRSICGSRARRPRSRSIDRLSGSFAFRGPAVVAAGYQARNVRATGSFAAGRLTLDAGAAAYGGTATAKGFIALPAPGRALAFDLRGKADSVDLREPAGAI